MGALNTALLWLSAPGCGLVAGLYFAFSTTVMPALSRLEPQSGVAAMVSINETILRMAFMPLFFGTSLAASGLLILAVLDPSQPDAALAGAGALVYLVGMFAVTVLFSVPLNTMLAGAVATPEATTQWRRYLQEWTLWNHVRALSSTLAAVLLTAALSLHQTAQRCVERETRGASQDLPRFGTLAACWGEILAATCASAVSRISTRGSRRFGIAESPLKASQINVRCGQPLRQPCAE